MYGIYMQAVLFWVLYAKLEHPELRGVAMLSIVSHGLLMAEHSLDYIAVEWKNIGGTIKSPKGTPRCRGCVVQLCL